MINGSDVKVIRRYVPIEYPKWVNGVLVQKAEEEQAHRAALAVAAEVANATELTRRPSPAGIRMRRTRELRRKGRMSIRLDVSVTQTKSLAMSGFIDPRLRDDPAEVARSVRRALDRLTCDGAML